MLLSYLRFPLPLLFSIGLLAACGGNAGLNLSGYVDLSAHRQDFIYCYGYGCTHKLRMGLTDPQWKAVTKIFRKKAKTPDAERSQISKAIALLESFTGKLAGTEKDLAKAPIVRQSMAELDCIDETVNTTQYLRFIEEAGLLRYHTVGRPAYKGGFVNGVYPHNTATLVEKETAQAYVVDSYIYPNGQKPDIRTLESWLRYRIEDLR